MMTLKGGSNPEEAVKFMLRDILSRDVQLGMTYYGTTSKMAFKTTHLCKILFGKWSCISLKLSW